MANETEIKLLTNITACLEEVADIMERGNAALDALGSKDAMEIGEVIGRITEEQQPVLEKCEKLLEELKKEIGE